MKAKKTKDTPSQIDVCATDLFMNTRYMSLPVDLALSVEDFRTLKSGGTIKVDADKQLEFFKHIQEAK